MARKKKSASSRPKKSAAGAASARGKAPTAVKRPPPIKVTFTRSDEYRVYAATGVWGGITPSGTVLANFMVQRRNEPESVTLDLKDGKYEEISRIEKGPEIHHVRELQCGVLLGLDDAFTIGKWLIEKSIEAGYQPVTLPKDEDEKDK